MDKKEKKSLPEPRTYTVEQIAAMLNIGRTTAYQLVKQEEFRIVRKCYEINYSENPNYADETGGQKSRNGANQEESQKFHYRAVEPQEEGNGRA